MMSNEKILIPLNKAQREKIKKKLNRDCDYIEVDRNELPNAVKYVASPVCISFDDKQEDILHKAFPDKECDYMLVTKADLPVFAMRYMPPRCGKSE
jgi:hypothetical protein